MFIPTNARLLPIFRFYGFFPPDHCPQGPHPSPVRPLRPPLDRLFEWLRMTLSVQACQRATQLIKSYSPRSNCKDFDGAKLTDVDDLVGIDEGPRQRVRHGHALRTDEKVRPKISPSEAKLPFAQQRLLSARRLCRTCPLQGS